MSLPSGSRLGPYEVLEPLGAGGMGEVYRGRDTRLERIVALKILPSHLSASEEVRQRFEREARAISALSHPHICALHDIGREGDTEYLVMEYLEGESLASRISRGPLPLEQVLRYGGEMADALDRAHRQGIVHRDLKPGNVMVTKSGVKLVDFGLAKVAAPAGPGSGISILQTQVGTNLTQEGTILGTFQYMAPEQLEGRQADARSDIFAFGALLYEMATGQKAFSGASQASLIASILGSHPPAMAAVAPMTPPALDRVVRTCLAKDPEDRWQSAHDVASELKWIAEAGSQAGVAAPVILRRKNRERIAWAAAAALALVAAAAIAGYVRRAPRPSPTVVTSIVTPEKRFVTFVAISPDETRVAFATTVPGGKNQLWVRSLETGATQPLPNTEGADHPFWAPDSRSIGFFADAKLKRTDVGGGPAVVLCDASPNGIGGAWNRDGTILFASPGSPISRIPEAGGTAQPVTRLDSARGETTHRYPSFLPDGRHFLYLAANLAGAPGDRANRIRVASVDSKEDREVIAAESNAVYANGYLFFQRGPDLLARRFDPRSAAARGAPISVAEHVAQSGSYWNMGLFSVSANGALAYASAAQTSSRLLWFDRSGRQIGVAEEPAAFTPQPPRISPDGRRAAFAVTDLSTRKTDVWIRDLERGTQTRLTTGPGDNGSASPVWSPDGKGILFDSDRKHQGDLYRKSIGGGAEEAVLAGEGQRLADDWSRDGRFIALELRQAKGDRRVALSILNVAAGTITLFHQRGVDIGDARFSPDGLSLAYSSDESGRSEVYVAAFPGPGERTQVSTSGGYGAVWRRDGKELYYLSSEGKLMAVEIRASANSAEAGPPQLLFEPHPRPISFDAVPDGQRFLVLAGDLEQSPPITLVQNWVPREAR